MRIGAVILVCAMTFSLSCSGGGLFRQYEYEEEMYLSLDGSASLYVNSSLQALNALRGTAFDTNPDADVDVNAVRTFFTSPVTEVVGRVRTSRRKGRRFVHVRVDARDIRKLSDARPFAWSSYQFAQDGELFIYKQSVGKAATESAAGSGWDGSELVAFRIHIPSRVVYHNAGEENLKRGNILVWEQPLAARLGSEPIELDARMQTQSILYRTLWLFAGTIGAVVVAFVFVIWLIMRRGKKLV